MVLEFSQFSDMDIAWKQWSPNKGVPIMRKFASFLSLALLSGTAGMAKTDASDAIIYVVKPGDTLSGLSQRYLIRNGDFRNIQKANGVANADILTIGMKLRIDRNLLKYQPASARIVSVRGNVTISQPGGTLTATNGLTVGEGAVLHTAGASFASLQLDDGSRISLPSNSDVRIARLRKYALGSSVDYDFDVGRGGVSTKVSPKSGYDRYQVRTPKAVSAVRGTSFQSRIDETSGLDFAEVIEGGLAVGVSAGTPLPIAAGSGLAVNPTGDVTVEALLPAPEIAAAGKLQMLPKVRFDFGKATSPAMRISLANDAGFQDSFADAVSADGYAEFEGIEDGNYFVRFKPVSANGFEGFPNTYAFKRRMNQVTGSAGKSDAGFAFKWSGDGRGVFRYHFQLHRNDKNSTPVVDEAGLTDKQIILSDLLPGDYYWRVASIQYVDGEVAENWTDFEKLTVSAP
jgi:hypothetical protein